MKRLSRNDLEAIADRVIRAYMKLPEVADRPIYRIYPEILAEKLLGLKIDYQAIVCEKCVAKEYGLTVEALRLVMETHFGLVPCPGI